MKHFALYFLSIFLVASNYSIAHSVMHITSQSQLNKEIIDNKKPAIVKFSSRTCPACISAEKPFNNLAKETPDIIFATVEKDKNRALFQKYNISSMPTFLYFNNGKIVETQTGYSPNFNARTKQTISRMVTTKN